MKILAITLANRISTETPEDVLSRIVATIGLHNGWAPFSHRVCYYTVAIGVKKHPDPRNRILLLSPPGGSTPFHGILVDPEGRILEDSYKSKFVREKYPHYWYNIPDRNGKVLMTEYIVISDTPAEELIRYVRGSDVSSLFSLRGLGNTPNGIDVSYFGFTCYMRPSEFLGLAAQMGQPDSFYEKQLQAGTKIAYPQLQVLEEQGAWKVQGHEGRHRIQTVQKLHGDQVLIPVSVIPLYTRNRSLDKTRHEEVFEAESNTKRLVFKKDRLDYDSRTLNP